MAQPNQWMQIPKGQKTLKLELIPTGVLEGVVYDMDGKPIPNATVSTQCQEHPQNSSSATTNEKGEYRLTSVPLDVNVTITATLEEEVVSVKTYRLRKKPPPEKKPEEAPAAASEAAK